jgi:hypothetical protein
MTPAVNRGEWRFISVKGRRMTSRISVALGFVFLMVLAGQPGGAAEPSSDRLFLQDLQKALQTNDKDWLGNHMHYPANFYGTKYIMIRNRGSFDSQYSLLFRPKLRAIVMAQDPDQLYSDQRGLKIGNELNIWFYNFGGAEDRRYEIITINDAE